MLCLKVRFEEQTLRFPLPTEAVGLGSSPDSGIRIPFPGVSRRHAVVEPVAGGIALRDSGSKNGLFFEGKRRREALLSPGGEVGIGRVWLSLEEAATSDVELALLVESGAGAGPSSRSRTRAETGTGTNPRVEEGAGDALRLVRECEAAREAGSLDPATILPQAGAILGATGVVLWGKRGESVALIAAWGTPPAEEGPDVGRTIDWRGRGETGLSALLPSAAEAAEPWRVDLIAYLGSVLTGTSAKPASRAAVRHAESVLVLPPGMVAGSSAAMRDLLAQVKAAAGSGIDILLTGETGTGKELIARAIHASSPGRKGTLVTVNCAAIPGELLEAELFGVQGRVATGVDPRPGRLLLAEGGTVLLDEVGELASALQAKILRFLQEREVHAIGAPAPRRVDLRVVAATNRDLREDVRQGRFRADLFYRLRGLELHVPPLRGRRDDIPELALAFVRRAAAESGKEIRGITRKALSALVAHDWPGNVRELEADIRRAVLVCPQGGSIGTEHLSSAIPGSSEGSPAVRDLRKHLAEEERRVLEGALEDAGGNRAEAARRLGLKRTTFLMRLRRGGAPQRHEG